MVAKGQKQPLFFPFAPGQQPQRAAIEDAFNQLDGESLQNAANAALGLVQAVNTPPRWVYQPPKPHIPTRQELNVLSGKSGMHRRAGSGGYQEFDPETDELSDNEQPLRVSWHRNTRNGVWVPGHLPPPPPQPVQFSGATWLPGTNGLWQPTSNENPAPHNPRVNGGEAPAPSDVMPPQQGGRLLPLIAGISGPVERGDAGMQGLEDLDLAQQSYIGWDYWAWRDIEAIDPSQQILDSAVGLALVSGRPRFPGIPLISDTFSYGLYLLTPRTQSLGTLGPNGIITHDHWPHHIASLDENIAAFTTANYLFVSGKTGDYFVPTPELTLSRPAEGTLLVELPPELNVRDIGRPSMIGNAYDFVDGDLLYYFYYPGNNNDGLSIYGGYPLYETLSIGLGQFSNFESENGNAFVLRYDSGPDPSQGDSGGGFFDSHGNFVGNLRGTKNADEFLEQIRFIVDAIRLSSDGAAVPYTAPPAVRAYPPLWRQK